jgi:hypothetical protein
MCVVSTIEHGLMLAGSIYPYLYSNLTTFILFDLDNFFLGLKRVIDFAVFFVFNANFKKVCLKRLKMHRS